MKPLSKPIFVLVCVLLVILSFISGVYYELLMGRQTVPLADPVASANVGVHADSMSGQVIATTPSTLTLKLSDGSTRVIAVGANTKVLFIPAPISKTVNDVVVGSTVTVVNHTDPNGAAMQQIQLYPVSTKK